MAVMMRNSECRVDECSRKCRADWMCTMHYNRNRLTGTTDPGYLLSPDRTPYSGLLRGGFRRAGECLLASGSANKQGYARIGYRGERFLAHRISYEKWNGPIPAGMVVDHTCHNEAAAAGLCAGGASCVHRACVNPTHLRVVTLAENTKSSVIAGKHWRDKTHCPKGHQYTEENIQRRKIDGGRDCRACDRARPSRYRSRKES